MRKVLFILGELNDADLEWMVTRGQVMHVPAGQAIIQQGRPIDSMFIVLDGAFAVTLEGPQSTTVATLGSGEMVGEMSLVDNAPPSATVRALRESRVLAMPCPALSKKLADDTGFAARFYRAMAIFLSDRLRSTTRTLGYGDAVSLDEHVRADDEIDPALLDKIALAGLRFDTMLRRLADA